MDCCLRVVGEESHQLLEQGLGWQMDCSRDEEQVGLPHLLRVSQVLGLAQPVLLELLEQQVDEEVRMKARLIQLRYPADCACSHRAAR
jgi:hypothetical protein